jgi:catechol 2,3-dioxygenase-like lactoylglutathione lyase family enzyme
LRKKCIPKKATLGFRTNDLATFKNFMVEQLGFELVKYQPEADMAYLLDIESDLMLLAGPMVENITDYVESSTFVLQPGATMRFYVDDIEAQRRKLIELGNSGITVKKGFAERVILLKGPEGYIIEFAVETDDFVEDVIAFSDGDGGALVVFHDADFDQGVEEDE